MNRARNILRKATTVVLSSSMILAGGTNVFEAEYDTPRVTKLIDRLRGQYRFR